MTALITDIDGTLTGHEQGLRELNAYLRARRKDFYLVYATGRCLEEFMDIAGSEMLLPPDAAIINTGADILLYSGGRYKSLSEWHENIADETWDSARADKILSQVKGVTSQAHISKYKVSYFTDPMDAGDAGNGVKEALFTAGIKAKVIISHRKFVDILPEKCDKGEAAVFLIKTAGIKAGEVIAAGDSENDLDLFMKFRRGIVVSNALENLKKSLNSKGLFFAERPSAAGILEGLRHYLR